MASVDPVTPPGFVSDDGMGLLERLRAAELESVRSMFAAGAKVLEIGGGSGFQAKILSSWGCLVTSLDICGRPHRRKQFFQVLDYDGVNLPFEDASFDIVFSSNVMEHARNLRALIRESSRVLVPGGRAIHIVPTSGWRIWTTLGHYPYLVKYLFGKRDIASAEIIPDASDILRRRGLNHLMKRIIAAGPHGECTSAAREVLLYRRKEWVRAFESAGLTLQTVVSTNLFYTGYALFPSLTVRTRRRLAKIMGSSCFAYILKAECPVQNGTSGLSIEDNRICA